MTEDKALVKEDLEKGSELQKKQTLNKRDRAGRAPAFYAVYKSKSTAD